MTNVLSLRGATAPMEPVPNVVAELEKRLEQARSGHLRAFAMACVTTGNISETGWEKAEGGTGAAGEINHALGSGILSLSWRFAQACQ